MIAAASSDSSCDAKRDDATWVAYMYIILGDGESLITVCTLLFESKLIARPLMQCARRLINAAALIVSEVRNGLFMRIINAFCSGTVMLDSVGN